MISTKLIFSFKTKIQSPNLWSTHAKHSHFSAAHPHRRLLNISEFVVQILRFGLESFAVAGGGSFEFKVVFTAIGLADGSDFGFQGTTNVDDGRTVWTIPAGSTIGVLLLGILLWLSTPFVPATQRGFRPTAPRLLGGPIEGTKGVHILPIFEIVALAVVHGPLLGQAVALVVLVVDLVNLLLNLAQAALHFLESISRLIGLLDQTLRLRIVVRWRGFFRIRRGFANAHIGFLIIVLILLTLFVGFNIIIAGEFSLFWNRKKKKSELKE